MHLQLYLAPLRYPRGEKPKARTRSASHAKISALFLLLYQFVHRTPWWGVKLRSEASPSHWEIALKHALMSLVIVRCGRNLTSQNPESNNKKKRRKLPLQRIYPVFFFCSHIKLWQFMEQEAGASPSVRKDVALKSVSGFFSPQRFTWFVCRYGSMSWWQIHAPISPQHQKSKSSGESLSCRTFHACRRSVWSRMCVRRASRSTDGTEPGGGRSSLCGLPCSFSQSKCAGKWRRCIKTWPGQR